MPQPKRLFLIDAMAMAFRSYYAFGMRPLTTSAGHPTSAVFGTVMFMTKLLSEQKPDYLAICCDPGSKTFRHEMYPQYKANRSQMPADLAAQMGDFIRCLGCFGAPVLNIAGVEADDLIGTLTKKYAGTTLIDENGASIPLEVYIVSGDKDFMQLVDDNVRLFQPKKGEDAVIIDVKGVHEKFGVSPSQVIDALAIIGDTSDNVPGVHGIGDKGAAKLMTQFGSLEGIYEHIDDVSNKKQRESLQAHREMAFLSRQLVTLKTDVSVPLTLDELRCDWQTAVANEPLLALVRELEFVQIAARVEASLSERKKAAAQSNVSRAGEHDRDAYKLVVTRADFQELVARLDAADEFCFDSETTGLDIISDRPIGLSFSVEPGKAFYVPLHSRHLTADLAAGEVLDGLRPIFKKPGVRKIGHNLKFDLQMLLNVDIAVSGPFLDTMIMDWLLDPSGRQHGLDSCCLRHLSYEKIKTSSLIGAKGQIPMLDVDRDQLAHYACEDADLTLRLARHLMPLIEASELTTVLNTVEMPLVPVLARMEREGIHIDVDALLDFSSRLGDMAKILEQKIHTLAGTSFNINSPKQLGEILFNQLKVHEQLGVKGLKKTKTGWSTDESVLTRLVGHPLPQAILEWRGVSKLKSTYVDALPQLVHPKTGRLHTSFHQTGTATGRLSSSDPNLQNIPIRTPLGQEIRKAFCAPRADMTLISADYSQIELRLLGHLAKEEALIQAFADGEDIHRATAARIFGLAPDQVDATLRSRAKAINFGIIYGMGPRRLSQSTGVSLKEASEFIERYFKTYPGIERYIKEAIQLARERGYSTTITGRRRPIAGFDAANPRDAIGAENIAVNSPIQGSAADLIKLAMIEIDAKLSGEGAPARMLLQVHDELVFEAPKARAAEAKQLIADGMRHAMDLSVPLDVQVDEGANWLEAH